MITIATLYYDQPKMIAQHYAEWQKYEHEARFIIIDDCSKTPLKKEAITNLKVYRVLDDIKWNQTGARNLAHLMAETEWVVSTDTDHVVTYDAFQKIKKLHIYNKNKIYFLNRTFTHGNKNNRMHSSFYVNREKYLDIKGHDEDLAGRYGGVDQSWMEICKAKLDYEWRDDIMVLNYQNHPIVTDASVKLDRDSKHNMKMIRDKSKNNFPRGPICRFKWEETRP